MGSIVSNQVLCSVMNKQKISATCMSLLLGVLGVAISYSVNAKCWSEPPPIMQADVNVQSCVGVTFSSSNSQLNFGGDKNANYYAQGESYSGTLITASVKKSWFVWEENEKHITNGFHAWPAKKSLVLFVAGGSNEVCPKQLFSPIRIQTSRLCCDVAPVRGKCLVPHSIETVSIITE